MKQVKNPLTCGARRHRRIMTMHNHWAEEFLRYAEKCGVSCHRIHYSNGWLETALIAGYRCFMKSVSYNERSRLYFLGVDPAKPSEEGDTVVLCGGRRGALADIFVVPWRKFFSTVIESEAVPTYRDREYSQYKFRIRDREGGWIASFQGGNNPTLDLTSMRFEPKDAVAYIERLEPPGN